MKKILIFGFMFSLFFLNNAAVAQQTEWLWANSAGENSYDYGNSVATDNDGNTYMAGQYSFSISFGSAYTFISQGSSDLFIVKYDPEGNVLWAKSVGSDEAEIAHSVAIDANGNIYLTGCFKSDEITFAGYTLTNAGGNTFDLFLAKYDSAGDLLWATSAGGTGDDRALGVAADANGNALVTGYFVSTSIVFGTTTLVNSGALDIFIAKYAPDGTALWANSAIGTGTEYSYNVATDKAGNSYICGTFNSNTLTFGPIVLNGIANEDIFVAKFSPAGLPLWAKQAGVSSDNIAYAVGADTLGNCFIGGSFKGNTLIFGTTTLNNSGHSDIFIAKYDPAGVPLWAKSSGGPNEDVAKGIAVDKYGYAYVTGFFKSPSITIGNTTLNNIAPTTADLFVGEFTPAGDAVLVKSAGGPGDDEAQDVSFDTLRNFFLTGYFSSTSLVFGNTTLTCGGTTDPFIVKSSNIPLVGTEEISVKAVVKIYPNPATTYIIVTTEKSGTIEVYNTMGQLLKSVTSGGSSETIDISDLKAGIYVVKVISEGKSSAGKFVKK